MIHSCWQNITSTSSISTLTTNWSLNKYPTHEMQERLTHPKGKAPCCICCWKGWHCWSGLVESLGWILCPNCYRAKSWCWTRLGHPLNYNLLVAPSGNLTEKYRICKQKQTIINHSLSFHHPDYTSAKASLLIRSYSIAIMRMLEIE